MSQDSVHSFDLNDEQQEALMAYQEGKSFLLTGPAGTVISKIVDSAIESEIKVGLTAMTGAAALLIGGKTLHSYLGIGLGEDSAQDLAKRARVIKPICQRWKSMQLLIVDEVSMLTADLLNKIDHIARTVRRNNQPMGGIQVILIGDFYQLPPVTKGKETRFCFESERWNEIVPHTVLLTQIMRQTDKEFQRCLTAIRTGSCPADVIATLQARMLKYESMSSIEPTRLYTRNADTDRINDRRLKSLGRDIVSFQSGIAYSNRMPQATKVNERLRSFLDKSAPCQDDLKLCEDVQVLLLYNLDFDKGLVNGSRGIVTKFEQGLPVVRFLNGHEVLVESHSWMIKDEESGFTVSKSQIPLKLAYALSTHRSQGMSLDLVEIDIGNSVFEAGQAYVALSRVRTLEGLFILDFAPERIRAHPKVKAFYDNIEKEKQNDNGHTITSADTDMHSPKSKVKK